MKLVIITGSLGSGKTTFVRVALGYFHHTSGLMANGTLIATRPDTEIATRSLLETRP